MNPMHPISRRELLKAAAAAPLCAPLCAPLWGGLRWLPSGDDRALVVLELSGGNDGLNTLIPTDDALYQKARPSLSAVRKGALPVADGFALHQVMGEMQRLFERGLCCAVHGVGYAPPDRSHFRSRDVWHTADVTLDKVTGLTTGWLGRAADHLAARGAAVPGLSIGSLRVPLALRGETVVAPSLQSLDDYQLVVDPAGGQADARRRELVELVRQSGAGDGSGDATDPGAGPADLDAFLGEVSAAALDSEARLRDALARYRPSAAFPDSDFGRALELLSRVLCSGFGTRLCHLSLGGFDTHARQAPAHVGLLRQLSAGLGALVEDLDAHGALDRVTVLVHSEFGRRVAENQSQGTDHGAAAPVFVLGAGLRPGLHGEPPDLRDLDDGDLRATCDFRRVYAALLGRLGIPAAEVLGEDEDFEAVRLFES